MPRAVGHHGSWYATVNDAKGYNAINRKRLPCLWSCWWIKPNAYSDPTYQFGDEVWAAFVDALKLSGFAILRAPVEPGVWKHDYYIAVFSIGNVRTASGCLKLELERRVCNLDR